MLLQNSFILKLSSVEKEVKQFIASIKDCPESRLKSRKDYYKKYGGSTDGEFGMSFWMMSILNLNLLTYTMMLVNGISSPN